MLYAFDQHLIQSTSIAPEANEDAKLLAAAAGGDEAALEALLARHGAFLQSVILKVMTNPADAEDVFQHCSLEIWKHAGEYDPAKGHALGWLVTMVRRRAIDATRRRTSYENTKVRYSAEPAAESEGSVAVSEAAQHDTTEVLARALSRLPAIQAQTIRMSFYNGLSQRQIAARTATPLGTVKTRLELGFAKLRSALASYGDWKTEFAVG